jgi:hypothetical protein
MLLVTLALKTVLSISQNGMDQITSNKQIDNHSNEDIINASSDFKLYNICSHSTPPPPHTHWRNVCGKKS